MVEPADRLGPMNEEPARRFNQWTSQFHWHLVVPSEVDEGARWTVGHIALALALAFVVTLYPL